MKKLSNLFKKISLPLVLILSLSFGGIISINGWNMGSSISHADFSQTQKFTNNLPDYMKIKSSKEAAIAVSNVDDTVYLFQNGSYNDIVIADQTLTKEVTSSGGSATQEETHYYYSPNPSNSQVFYYFDFTTSLSLFYDMTAADIAAGKTGENLLKDRSIENYTLAYSESFNQSNTISTLPKQFNLRFKLNTLNEQIEFGVGDKPEGYPEKDKDKENQITLNKEGIYTLVIPVLEYYTTNGGITFSLTTREIYYNFMIFNANTYFDTVTGKPRISTSSNIQETTLTASSTYSTYYFYNFAYSKTETNTLPTIDFDPLKFSLEIDYSDIELNTKKTILEYQNGKVVQLDENGAELSENNQFIRVITNDNGTNSVVFSDIGSYDIHFSYLYTIEREGQTTLYDLNLENLSKGSAFSNKAQRVYIYGYQTVYSDYENINPDTNQPYTKDIKSYDDKNGYYNSADITSQVNKNIIDRNNNNEFDNTEENTENSVRKDIAQKLSETNPVNNVEFNVSTLKNLVLEAINNPTLNILPASTNQTPIKFLTNAKNTSFSKFYKLKKVTTKDEATGIETTQMVIDNGEGTSFQGFNQNDDGTYLYIIQYQFDSYMSASGTLQSALYHYQVFYFTITNSSPTVAVLDGNFNEVYTNGFTNKNVYILNDAENNIYDAKVNITLSAQNYNDNTYYFQDVSIKELSSYGFAYRQFVESSENSEFDDKYNENIAGKYGILIENNNNYANAKFTIKITSANSNKPSTRTFTIDTSEIKNITSKNVTLLSSTTYQVGDAFSSFNTNQPMIMSWDEKKSGATTYGYVTYIPTKAINYYSSQSGDDLSELLNRLIANDVLPVSYKIDLASRSQWTEYSNAATFGSTIPATYVKNNDGFYILQVYDQAGNSAFKLFMIDTSTPIFIQETQGNQVLRSLFSNSDSISLPETNVEIYIRWSSRKAIYLENIDKIGEITSYQYSTDVAGADLKLKELVDEFFKTENNANIMQINDITTDAKLENDTETTKDGTTTSIVTGISSYNGNYLIIPINERVYIKDGFSSEFSPYDLNSYQIRFFDDNGNSADNTTFKILIRDKSNTYYADNESMLYRNFPSGYVSFNVTADASKLKLSSASGDLDFSSFSFSGNLYTYQDDQGKYIYTHIKGDNDYTETSRQYKFSYYTPVSGKEALTLSYIPVAVNGSKLETVTLYYYPYEKKLAKFEGNNNYYYYYDLAEDYTQKINVFPNSTKEYDVGAIETFELAMGSNTLPLAGKYMIERTYKEDSGLDQYDYFRRFLTIIVDDKGLITKLEPVVAVDDEGNALTDDDGKTISSLESIVGGDILLSLYSGNGNSSIEISFPKYTSDGLNSGSFFTKDSYGENDNLSSFAVQGNKLPISLHIPKYKYTVSNEQSINSSNGKEYSVNKNDNLSYYGNAYYQFNRSTSLYDVYIEGALVQSFGREQQAKDYIETSSIKEYQILTEVRATVVENGREVVKYYYSDGTEKNGYLTLYEASGKNGILNKNAELEFFYLKGNYVVTIYQASNIGATSSFYSLYKFGFEIISQAPDFEIIGSDGYNLTETDTPNTYYTNSHSLKVQWEVPTSEYEAKIDENNISIRYNPSSIVGEKSEIVDEGTSKYFTIDTERLLNVANSYVEITMQYEGHNRDYYSTITKRIYFDKSMPYQNVQNLMSTTEISTQNSFPMNYQLLYMRKYFDYNNREVENPAIADIPNLSYSYSTDSGNFKYYSYNVNIDYFNTTLTSTLANKASNPYDTQFIYYNRIENIKTYTQVDKASFSSGNYLHMTTDGDLQLPCGYYEIVEMDYAGNMVVYVVELTSSNVNNDPLARTDAITYTNTNLNRDVVVENDQIQNGFNIYSTKGFEIKDINYQSDSWQFLTLKLAGQGEVRYMKSPWIDDTQIYKVIFSANGVEFNQVSLLSLFENVEASSNKHKMTLSNRIDGSFASIFISVMEASLSTQKVEDPTQTSAILNITVPTKAQVQSETTSYIFPKSITISQFDSSVTAINKWKTIYKADQFDYGTWTPSEEFAGASYITFKTLPGDTTLQIAINLGANASQKVKFEIIDNFEKTTTVIQLANEVSYKEISGPNAIYKFSEGEKETTYLSSGTINYSYNVLLYSVKVYDRDGNEIRVDQSHNTSTNISVMKFNPSFDSFYDDYYKLVISDVESEEYINTIHLRLYNKLPSRVTNPNDVSKGGIIFNDKNQQPIDEANIGIKPNVTVSFNGKDYTATSEIITTFSRNVTVRFFNGQSLAYDGSYNYQKGYTYSVYLSKDNGTTWENINSANSDVNGYTISGVGDYIVLIKYDSDEYFTDLCKIFNISILDSSTSYYYITVDGLTVDKSDVYYTSLAGQGYETNYIVSVDYADRDNRRRITTNEELNVKLDLIAVDSTGSNVTVEIYRYECSESAGEFTIIYIAETNNIISTFTYESSVGTPENIKNKSFVTVVANSDSAANFNKLKINFSSYYGIVSNKINIEVTKQFNGSYVKIDTPVYTDGIDSFIYLNRQGSYRLKVYDSCSPANVQTFGTSKYIDIVFLSSVPFTVTTTNAEGEEIITEPIQKAIYNGKVVLKPTNIQSYYQGSGTPTIHAKRNGYDYTGFTTSGKKDSFTFTASGFYTVYFTAVSLAEGKAIRTEEFSFTIINKNESRYAFEYSEYEQYYIKAIEKDGVDITENLLTIGNFPSVIIDDQKYLSGITINYLDEKTGGGRYKVTICPNNKELLNTIGESFAFEFWINMATPPISVSLPEGEKTKDQITVTLNVQNLHDAVGDCYLIVGGTTRYYNTENLSSYGTNDTVRITGNGTYYIQIYTSSGYLLYSYKVTKTEPLNAFAIIAIVLGCVAAVAIVTITILLRKRQKVSHL